MGQRTKATERDLLEQAGGRLARSGHRSPTAADVAPSVQGMLALQRLAGNRATSTVAAGPTVQRNIFSKVFHKIVPRTPAPAAAGSQAYQKATAHLPFVDAGHRPKQVRDPVAELGFTRDDCDDLVTSQRVPALVRKWAMASGHAEAARCCIEQEAVEQAGAKQDPHLLQWVNRTRPAVMAQYNWALKEARSTLVQLRAATAVAAAKEGAATPPAVAIAPKTAAVYGFTPNVYGFTPPAS